MGAAVVMVAMNNDNAPDVEGLIFTAENISRYFFSAVHGPPRQTIRSTSPVGKKGLEYGVFVFRLGLDLRLRTPSFPAR